MLVLVSRQRPRAALLVCVLALGLSLLASAPARASVLHVSPTGSDTAQGGASTPLATIGRAAVLARSGDVVLVAGGSYPETVDLPGTASGVTLRGDGDARPVIEGEGKRDFGFTTSARGLADVTIERFELRDQGEAAISLRGQRMTIADNVIHHIGADGRMDAYGIHVSYGSAVRVLDNEISSIGPGGQATGVLLTTMRDTTVAGNEIRMIRKEGVRDSWGLDNVVRDNAISLCWTGLSFNTSTGSVATGNYLHDNVQGFNPKHVSEPRVLAYWGLDQAHWSLFHSNTVYRSTDSSIALAMNAPAADFLDVRANVLSGAGGTFVADAPWTRGSQVVLDENLYSAVGGRPAWAYHTGYDFRSDGFAGLAGVRSALGWEANGRWEDAATPRTAGASPSASALARVEGAGDYGATRAVPETRTWTPLPMQPIHSTSAGSWYTNHHLDETADGVHHTYWLTDTNRDESVTYDFGERETFQQLILDVYAHEDNRNVRGYRFEVSDDDRTYRTVLAGENPDAFGSNYKYELSEPATARYLRFTLVDTFCESYAPRTGCGQHFVLSDLQAGRLVRREDQPPAALPETPAPSPAPASPATPGSAAAQTLQAPSANLPAPPAPAPAVAELLVGADAIMRARSIRVLVACRAVSCRGTMAVRGGGAAGRRAFRLSAGTHLVVVPVRRRPRARGPLRALVRAHVDGRPTLIKQRLGLVAQT